MIIKNALVYTEDHKFEKKDVSLKEIDDMLSSVDEVLDDTK